MKHHIIFNASAITGLALMLAPVAGLAQEKTLKEQIVGTWSNVAWVHTYPDGRKEEQFGAKPKGVSTFDSNGRFVVIMLHPDLPKLASSDRWKPTPEEAMTIAKGSLAYYGTYTVNEADKSVQLDVEGTSYANQVGAPQKRIVTGITSDELRYRNLGSTSGGVIEFVSKRLK